MKLILVWAAAVAFGLVAAAHASEFPKRLERALSLSRLSDERFEVREVPCPGVLKVRPAAYADLGLRAMDDHALCAAARLLEQRIYAMFVEKLVPNPLSEAERIARPIHVVFDRLPRRDGEYLLPPAEFVREFSKRYDQDVILLDIDRLNDLDTKYILAHELQHVFRFQRNPGEADWLNEGLSRFAEYYLFDTFPVFLLESFLRAPSQPLNFDYRSADPLKYLNDFLFVDYLFRHAAGIDGIRDLMRSEASGEEAVDEVLRKRSDSCAGDFDEHTCFKSALARYHVALSADLYASRVESNGSLEIRLPLRHEGSQARVAVEAETLRRSAEIEVPSYGARYFRIEGSCLVVQSIGGGNGVRAVMTDFLGTERQLIEVEIGQRRCFPPSLLRGKNPTGRFVIVINTDSFPTRVGMTLGWNR